jgi:hypothetical protein
VRTLLAALAFWALGLLGIGYVSAACPTCSLSDDNELEEIATPDSVAGLIETCAEGACLGESIGAANGEAKLRFFCNPSHYRYDDPIINPGAPGATHLHVFFGNMSAGPSSTYYTLRKTGAGSCQGGILNRTAYWMPAMIDPVRNKVVVPRVIEFYYHINEFERFLSQSVPGEYTSAACPGIAATRACPTYGVRDIPKGLRLVSGVNPATGVNGDGNQIYWSCINPNTGASNGEIIKPVFHDPDTPSNGIQNCVSTNDGASSTSFTIQVTLQTQDCWNGELDSEDHHTHVKARVSDGVSRNICPTTHPYLLPSLVLIVAYDVDDTYDYKNWFLSSDRHNGATWRGGSTFHADFLWAWDPDVMRLQVDNIWALDGVAAHRTCAAGCLGDGTKLITNGTTTTWKSVVNRFIDIPGRGAKGKIKARVR